MKAPTGKLAFAYRTIAALEAERDALAQRCQELEHMLKHARMDADAHYADTLTLRAEAEALRGQLAESRSNDRTAMGYLTEVRAIVGGEDFPAMVRNVDALRAEVDLLERIAHHLARIYVVSDEAYDPDAEVERAMTRLKEAFK